MAGALGGERGHHVVGGAGGGELGEGFDVGAFEEAMFGDPDGLFGAAEVEGDLVEGLAGEEEIEDLLLARGELGFARAEGLAARGGMGGGTGGGGEGGLRGRRGGRRRGG